MSNWLNNWLVRFSNWLFPVKRCKYCANPLEEQKYGIDGVICDACVEIHAPWMNEPIDPLWLAIMSMPSYYWHDHDGFGDPF